MIEIITSLVVSCMICFFFMNFHIKQINKLNDKLLEDIEKSDTKFRESITDIALDIVRSNNDNKNFSSSNSI